MRLKLTEIIDNTFLNNIIIALREVDITDLKWEDIKHTHDLTTVKSGTVFSSRYWRLPLTLKNGEEISLINFRRSARKHSRVDSCNGISIKYNGKTANLSAVKCTEEGFGDLRLKIYNVVSIKLNPQADKNTMPEYDFASIEKHRWKSPVKTGSLV